MSLPSRRTTNWLIMRFVRSTLYVISSASTSHVERLRRGRVARRSGCSAPLRSPTSAPRLAKNNHLVSPISRCMSPRIAAARAVAICVSSRTIVVTPSDLCPHSIIGSPLENKCGGSRETSPLRHLPNPPHSRLGPALLAWDEVALVVAGVDLLRASDLLLLVIDQLEPLCEPAGRTRNSEQHGEHLRRELQRLVDEAGVEVDVRVELAGDEVLVLERHLLQLHGD